MVNSYQLPADPRARGAGGLSEDEKIAHALTLNLKRRHLSREQRERQWADMRRQGMTYRDIAAADGSVGKSTVQTVVQNRTTAQPPTITGKDGKQYPATRPKTTYGYEHGAVFSLASRGENSRFWPFCGLGVGSRLASMPKACNSASIPYHRCDRLPFRYGGPSYPVPAVSAWQGGLSSAGAVSVWHGVLSAITVSVWWSTVPLATAASS